MADNESISLSDAKRRLVIVAGLCLPMTLWCWLDHRRLDSRWDSHGAIVEQIDSMNDDADRIRLLRTAPRLAVERVKPNDELLDDVRRAMSRARIADDHWVTNDPSPAVRVSKTPYKRLDTRLSFRDLSLRDLVSLVYHLTDADPALNIPHLQLSMPAKETGTGWKVDLVVSYLIYSPHQTR